MNRQHLLPILQALLAALLFGASAPFAKLLLGEVAPVSLAAFLYLGSGLGVLGAKLVQRLRQGQSQPEAGLQRSDLLWLAGAILAGGVAAPIALLFSLRATPAAIASLLLSFEGVATTLIAFFAFKEAIGRRAWTAIGLITLASILLAVNFQAGWGFSLGALGVLAACVLWGIDNNFTRHISAKDPLTIVTVKGLAAGSFSLGLAWVLGDALPGPGVVLGALILGGLSYGASIVLFIHAMRGLGAARTSTLFSAAPFAGMVFSFFLFREMPGWMFLLALPLLVIGTWLMVNEQHEHYHVHEVTLHEHAHNHTDGHHDDHEHVGLDPAGAVAGKHSHVHRHARLAHHHHHLPDLHHRHTHATEA